VKLRFVTEELAFDSDEDAATFICDNGGEEFLQELDGAVRLICSKESATVYEQAKNAAFRKVDIKGQI
jgi:hypothetical protein